MTHEKAHASRRLVPWIVYLLFFAVLNETVFNVSTPMIAKQFALTPAGVSWMMTIFLVFFGIGSVIYGKLSDLFSLRLLILVGIVVYDAGSLLGFFLQGMYSWVIVARAVQGIGASALPALIFVVAARYFPPSERGRVFGYLTATVSLAIGLGPVVGGFVSQALHWSFLFLIPLVILVAAPFLFRELPVEPRRPGKVDLVGAILTAATVGSLVLFLNFPSWSFFALFAVLTVGTVIWMTKVAEPFLEPELLKNRPFRTGVVTGFCLFAIVIGVLFLIPLMLSDLWGLDTASIGWVLFPGAISSVIFGPVAGSLADRRGNSFVVAVGLVLLTGSLVLLAFGLSASVFVIGTALFLTYVGFSLFQTAMINSVSQTLPENETGVGMGLFNLAAILSGAVGTALVGKVLEAHWFAFPLLSNLKSPKAWPYSNLMLVFGFVVILGGVYYLRNFRGVVSNAAQRDPLSVSDKEKILEGDET